jgi:hypothetical protein
MAEFTAVANLELIVAEMIAPEVRKIAKKVESTARRLAPAGKRWISMADNRVRDTHVVAHSLDQLPANLRFAVPKQPWDAEHGLGEGGGIDHLLGPKDTSTGLPLDSVQHVHCRCKLALDPAAIAKTIKAGPAEVSSAGVTVRVVCVHEHAVAAEYGEVYGEGIVSPGTHFMARAAARVAGNGGGYGISPDAQQLGARPTTGGENN